MIELEPGNNEVLCLRWDMPAQGDEPLERAGFSLHVSEAELALHICAYDAAMAAVKRNDRVRVPQPDNLPYPVLVDNILYAELLAVRSIKFGLNYQRPQPMDTVEHSR